MSEKPLVSVILPFFNTRPTFMVEAIDSVLSQEYTEWELLIVDDGSTRQESIDVASAYVAQHNRIHYLKHSGGANRGPSAARQLAIGRARGSLVAFLDADDLWLPRKLFEQVALLQGFPEAGALYGNTMYWLSWAPGRARDYQPALSVKKDTLYQPLELLRLSILGKIAIPCPCSLIVRREALDASGGFEENYVGIFEDQVFYAKLFLTTPVMISASCWDLYRQHPDSATHRASSRIERMLLHRHYLDWLATYLRQQGVSDADVWQALHRTRWQYQQPGWLPQSDMAYYLSRFLKKWLLHVGENLLPPSIQRRLWSTVVEESGRSAGGG